MGRRLIQLGCVYGILLGLLALAAPAAAQTKSVVVLRRDGAIAVQQNGDVRVAETWEVKFAGGPFRYAFRAIPLHRLDDITGWQVGEGGRRYRESATEEPYTFEVEDDSGERTITWYFEPTTDRTRTFQLEYTLIGALRLHQAGDQLFWKFIESGRGYPIQASRVVISLPPGAGTAELATQTYLDGVESGRGRIVDGRTVEFKAGPFGTTGVWEVRVQFPHGLVSAPQPRWQAHEERVTTWRPVGNLVSLVLALVILCGGLLGLYLLWFLRGCDSATGLIAEFYPKPPEAIPPGMAGTLLDERVDMQDILATVVDLARRGYLRIAEDRKGGHRFIRLRGDDGALRPYESLVLQKLFGRRAERRLEDLKHSFTQSIGEVTASLYDETVQAGYLAAHPERTRLGATLSGIGLVVVASVAGGIGYVVVFDYAPLGILVVIAAVLVGIALSVVGQFLPVKTRQGAVAAARWRAFRRYLQHIDRYTQVEQAQDQFDRYLPYAIAFGIDKTWVRAFERVKTPPPAWYQADIRSDAGRSSSRDEEATHSRSGSNRPGGSQHSRGGVPLVGHDRGMPSLDGLSQRAFAGLNRMSASFFSMLDSAATTMTSAPASAGSSSGGGGFSGGGSGGDGSGGGSSGFG